MDHQSLAKTNQLNQHEGGQPASRPAVSVGLSPHPIHRLQDNFGNRGLGRLIQAKLRISEPGDVYEQEADRVADQVVRMPDTATTKQGAVSEASETSQIQRSCSGCEEVAMRQAPEEEEEEDVQTMQTKQVSGGSSEATSAVEARVGKIRGGGQSLPESTRGFFESRFGYDFSPIRIHTDEQAADSARAVNALAYTVGRDVVFGAGQYRPETTEGRKLLAHELTHTVQQGVASTEVFKSNSAFAPTGSPPLHESQNVDSYRVISQFDKNNI